MPPDGELRGLTGRLIPTPIGGRIVPTPGPPADVTVGRVVKGAVIREVDPTRIPVDPLPKGVIGRRPDLLLRSTIPIIRPEDLLVVEFELVNLEVRSQGDDGKPLKEPQLVRTAGDADAFLLLHLPPQNVAEQAFFEVAPGYPADESGPDEPIDPPVLTRLSGTSRIAFKVPAGFRPIPYSVKGLLEACGELELSVAGTALPPSPPALSFVEPFQPGVLTPGGLALFEGTPRWVRELPATKSTGTGGPAEVNAVVHAARSLRWLEGAAVEMHMAPSLVTQLEEAVAIERPPVRLKPRIAKPEPTQTAIEAPYRLIVSPSSANGWAHRTDAPAAESGRVELWHTRLGTRRDGTVVEGPSYLRAIRAIWARSGQAVQPRGDEPPALPSPDSPSPFRMSLDSRNRYQIVRATSDYELYDEPGAIGVDNLMLSSLGAWIDTKGTWEPREDVAIEEWRHRATMGRDHYVRVVERGYLFPFGHRASLVKITERKFHPGKPGNPAYLRQRMFVVVREPFREYGAANHTVDDDAPLAAGPRVLDRELPFSSVRVTTLVTPNLDPPEDSDVIDGARETLFWPSVGREPFKFHIVAVDIEGNTIELTAPLAYVSHEHFQTRETLRTLRKSYEESPAHSRIPLFGQKVAYAESRRPGDTSFETEAVTFGAEVPAGDAPFGPDRPAFYPCIRRAEARVPVVKQLSGNDTAATFAYGGAFLAEAAGGGFGAGNKGEVFFEVAGGKTLPLDFGSAADRAGGFLQPSIGVKGLSRVLGPVSGKEDLAEITEGRFKPSDFFSHLQAKLFGVLDLKDVVAGVGLDEAFDAVPRFVSEQLTAAESFLAELQRIRSQLEAVRAQAGAEAAKVEAALARLEEDFAKVTETIGLVVGGAEDADVAAAVAPLAEHLPEAATMLRGLPPEVGAARDQALATIERFAATIADVEAYVARLLEVLRLPDELKVRFEWKPKLQDWPAGAPIFVASRGGKAATLTVAAEVSAKSKLNPEPSIDVVCRLENFTLDLIGNLASFIKLHFDKIEFVDVAGSKTDVNVEFAGIEFTGPLSFVEALRDLIPLDGFSDPPALTVSEKGIESSFSLALPNVAFGVFSLQNLSLGAGFKVPFIGDPLSVRFQFCERESPFLLTVSAFGGGGFFGIELDPTGVKLLEASFEFGASLSVDFGVASGGVYVMGGIYFKYQDNDVDLVGYLRMGGNVEVLGIVSVSIELMMVLGYESGKCVGRATISIEVEVAFFSTTVEISCERKFAGSNGDPSFEQLMAPEDGYRPWDEYCDAFADVKGTK